MGIIGPEIRCSTVIVENLKLVLVYSLLNAFQILQITAIENEVNNRAVPVPFVKFVGQPNTEISSQAMTAITWTQEVCN